MWGHHRPSEAVAGYSAHRQGASPYPLAAALGNAPTGSNTQAWPHTGTPCPRHVVGGTRGTKAQPGLTLGELPDPCTSVAVPQLVAAGALPTGG